MKFSKGQIFKNTSGKHIQVPNRLSPDFSWQPDERINIESLVVNVRTGLTEGYIVNNQDYCGVERCFESSFITEDLLNANFSFIGEIKDKMYNYFPGY